eukprot:12625-Pleurochrysis_carterae.AAC.1
MARTFLGYNHQSLYALFETDSTSEALVMAEHHASVNVTARSVEVEIDDGDGGGSVGGGGS